MSSFNCSSFDSIKGDIGGLSPQLFKVKCGRSTLKVRVFTVETERWTKKEEQRVIEGTVRGDWKKLVVSIPKEKSSETSATAVEATLNVKKGTLTTK